VQYSSIQNLQLVMGAVVLPKMM